MKTGNSDSLEIGPVGACVLRAVSCGRHTAREIGRATGLSQAAVKSQVALLGSRKLIESEGLVAKKWRLTENGMIALLDRPGPDGPAGTIFQAGPGSRERTVLTTSTGTAFRASFGMVLGVFCAVVTVGFLASVIYWAAYTLFVRQHVPDALAPFVPLDGFRANAVLGFITSISLFLPFRKGLRWPGR